MIILTKKQKEILTKYDVVFEGVDFNKLLENIDSEMTRHQDDYGEPLADWLTLENVYDEILEQNQ